MKQRYLELQKGQLLVLLLVFTVVAVMIITAAVMLIFVNTQAGDKVYQGTTALDVAESGVETAMIKLLRDPSYTGETLSVSGGQAVVAVSGTNSFTITSTGTIGNFKRRIQVSTSFANNMLTITSWKEL